MNNEADMIWKKESNCKTVSLECCGWHGKTSLWILFLEETYHQLGKQLTISQLSISLKMSLSSHLFFIFVRSLLITRFQMEYQRNIHFAITQKTHPSIHTYTRRENHFHMKRSWKRLITLLIIVSDSIFFDEFFASHIEHFFL